MPLSAILTGLVFSGSGFFGVLTFDYPDLLRETCTGLFCLDINFQALSTMRQCTCFFHGASHPNPGNLGLGVVVLDENGVEIITASVNGGKGTNNVSAYRALILAFELCLKGGIGRVNIFGDSQVVINQVLGEWVVQNETLIPLQEKAQELGAQLDCNLNWVKKADNKRACELSQLAIGASSNLIWFAQDPQGVVHEPSEESNEGHPTLVEVPCGENDLIHQDTSNRLESAVISDGVSRPCHVFVKGLRGGKVAFVYGQDVVIFDFFTNHCTCSQFKIGGSCEHAEAIGRVSRKKAG